MFKYTKKIISLVLIVSFILTSAIPSYGFNGRTLFTHKSHAQRHISSSEEYKDIIKTPSLLDIPNELGRIIEYHKGKSNSLVVHIQDRHIDPLTQNNIAEIIKRVNQAHSIHLVCLEGAAQELDTSFYDSFDNTPSKQRVAEFFLQKGIFTGPEFFKITNKDTYIRAVGVENEELYLRHLASYRKNELDKDSVIELLRSMKSALEKTKRILYSKELKELDSINTSYKYQQLNLTEYLLKLKQYADKAGIDTAQYRDLSQFIKLVEKEKSTNFGKAETEREALIKDLSDSLDTQQTRELLQMSLDFRVNKISDIAFYNYLESLIVNYALPVERYENLLHYVEYIEFSKTINYTNVFDQADDLEDHVKIAFCKNPQQIELVRHSKTIGILEDLYNLKLTPRKLDYVKKNAQLFDMAALKHFVQNASSEYGINLSIPAYAANLNTQAIENAREFYALAIKRDTALIENTLRSMRQYHTDKAVLVTGGFHTQGITNILKQKDISYVVICPTIGLDDCDEIYASRMNGQLLSAEDIQEFFTQTLAPPSLVAKFSGDGLKDMQGLYRQTEMLFQFLLENAEVVKYMSDKDYQLLESMSENMHDASEKLRNMDSALQDMVKNIFIDEVYNAYYRESKKGDIAYIGLGKMQELLNTSIEKAPAEYANFMASASQQEQAETKPSSAGELTPEEPKAFSTGELESAEVSDGVPAVKAKPEPIVPHAADDARHLDIRYEINRWIKRAPVLIAGIVIFSLTFFFGTKLVVSTNILSNLPVEDSGMIIAVSLLSAVTSIYRIGLLAEKRLYNNLVKNTQYVSAELTGRTVLLHVIKNINELQAKRALAYRIVAREARRAIFDIIQRMNQGEKQVQGICYITAKSHLLADQRHGKLGMANPVFQKELEQLGITIHVINMWKNPLAVFVAKLFHGANISWLRPREGHFVIDVSTPEKLKAFTAKIQSSESKDVSESPSSFVTADKQLSETEGRVSIGAIEQQNKAVAELAYNLVDLKRRIREEADGKFQITEAGYNPIIFNKIAFGGLINALKKGQFVFAIMQAASIIWQFAVPSVHFEGEDGHIANVTIRRASLRQAAIMPVVGLIAFMLGAPEALMVLLAVPPIVAIVGILALGQNNAKHELLHVYQLAVIEQAHRDGKIDDAYEFVMENSARLESIHKYLVSPITEQVFKEIADDILSQVERESSTATADKQLSETEVRPTGETEQSEDGVKASSSGLVRKTAKGIAHTLTTLLVATSLYFGSIVYRDGFRAQQRDMMAFTIEASIPPFERNIIADSIIATYNLMEGAQVPDINSLTMQSKVGKVALIFQDDIKANMAFIVRYARENNIDPEFLAAVILTEQLDMYDRGFIREISTDRMSGYLRRDSSIGLGQVRISTFLRLCAGMTWPQISGEPATEKLTRGQVIRLLENPEVNIMVSAMALADAKKSLPEGMAPRNFRLMLAQAYTSSEKGMVLKPPYTLEQLEEEKYRTYVYAHWVLINERLVSTLISSSDFGSGHTAPKQFSPGMIQPGDIIENIAKIVPTTEQHAVLKWINQGTRRAELDEIIQGLNHPDTILFGLDNEAVVGVLSEYILRRYRDGAEHVSRPRAGTIISAADVLGDKSSSSGASYMPEEEKQIAEKIYKNIVQIYIDDQISTGENGSYMMGEYSKENVNDRENYSRNPYFYPVTFASEFKKLVDTSMSIEQQKRYFDYVLERMHQAQWKDIFWEVYLAYNSNSNMNWFCRDTRGLPKKLNSLRPIDIKVHGDGSEMRTGILEHLFNRQMYDKDELKDFREAKTKRTSWLLGNIFIYDSRDNLIKAVRELHAVAGRSLKGTEISNGLSQPRLHSVENDQRPLHFPNPERLDFLMKFLALRITGDPSFSSQHPIIQAAEIFLRIMDMQYFPDGNRRTARLMLNYHLMLNGYPKMFVDNDEEYLSITRFMRTPEELADFIADGYLARHKDGKWDLEAISGTTTQKASSAGTVIIDESLRGMMSEVINRCTEAVRDPLDSLGRGRITFITNARSFTQEDKDFLERFNPANLTIITADSSSSQTLYNITGFKGNILTLDDYQDCPEWFSMPQEEKIARVAVSIRGQNTAVITVTNNTIAQKIPEKLEKYKNEKNDRQKGTIVVASMQEAARETIIGKHVINEGDIMFSITASYAINEVRAALQGVIANDQMLILDVLPPIDSHAFEKFINNLMQIKTSTDAVSIAA